MAETKGNRPTYATDFITTDIEKVTFFGNVHIDNMMTTLLAMGNELWVQRKRQHILEALLAEKGVKPEAIEKYVATPAQEQAWAKERDVLVARLWSHHDKNTGEYNFASDWNGK
ncbi:MAG: hypothetical protein FJX59_00215 [Alphaproteobacteria bacterium]|nr:hypothetical protein [Alphaproteobacteria bacterium]